MIDYVQALSFKADLEKPHPVNETEPVVSGGPISEMKKNRSSGKMNFGKYFLLLLVVVAVIIGAKSVLSQQKTKPARTTSVPEKTATFPIEKEFTFKAYDKNKKLTKEIKYTVSSVELTKQIVIKGQKASAAKGRIFLIISLKLVNDSEESIFINSRNYLRIQPVGTNDKLAPEIHNDTVEIQPLSTKMTRLGLPVYEAQKEFKLIVGEIDQEKEEIEIKF